MLLGIADHRKVAGRQMASAEEGLHFILRRGAVGVVHPRMNDLDFLHRHPQISGDFLAREFRNREDRPGAVGTRTDYQTVIRHSPQTIIFRERQMVDVVQRGDQSTDPQRGQ